MREFEKSKVNSNLQQIIKEIERRIEEAEAKGEVPRLPWQEPYFIYALRYMCNPFREHKSKTTTKPAIEPHIYEGMKNAFFLFMGMERAKARTGKADNRFIPMSALKSGKYGNLHKKGGRITGIDWDEINAISDIKEKKARIREEYQAREVCIFFPRMVTNNGFDPDLPISNDNQKKVMAGFGVGTVVNVADTNLVQKGLLEPLVKENKVENPKIEILENAILRFPHRHLTEDSIPHYNRRTKNIYTPGLDKAKNSLSHYATVLHELGHQVGDMLGEISDKSRMDRKAVSEEELIAEFTASYVLSKLGYSSVDSDEARNTAAYCLSWVRKFKDDPEILFRAAGKAQQRGDMILNGEVPILKMEEPESFPYVKKVFEAA